MAVVEKKPLAVKAVKSAVAVDAEVEAICARAGMEVVLKDVAVESAEKGNQNEASRNLGSANAEPKLSGIDNRWRATCGRIHGATMDYFSSAAAAGVTEKLRLARRRVFSRGRPATATSAAVNTARGRSKPRLVVRL